MCATSSPTPSWRSRRTPPPPIGSKAAYRSPRQGRKIAYQPLDSVAHTWGGGCSDPSFLPIAIESRRDFLVRRELTATCFLEALLNLGAFFVGERIDLGSRRFHLQQDAD